MLPGSKCSVVLLRLVMQDFMRVVFDVWPEVRYQVDVGGSKLYGQAQQAGEAAEAAWKV